MAVIDLNDSQESAESILPILKSVETARVVNNMTSQELDKSIDESS